MVAQENKEIQASRQEKNLAANDVWITQPFTEPKALGGIYTSVIQFGISVKQAETKMNYAKIT